MLVEKNKQEVKHIESLGFKKVWLSDKSGSWYSLKIKN